ncbi:MAG: hypothetical protein ACE3JQ_04290 [Paenisporosarcina sp.]
MKEVVNRDLSRKFKRIEILDKVSDRAYIILGMVNSNWNGLIEYPLKIKAESNYKIDSAFLFYKTSPPTSKEWIHIEKYFENHVENDSIDSLTQELTNYESKELLYSEWLIFKKFKVIIKRNLSSI